MYDIIALGELLIDFTPAGKNEHGYPMFAQNPGGAPANLLTVASRMGLKTAMMGKLGDDSFGAFLKNVLAHEQVDVRGLMMDKLYDTTLAFVHLGDDGDRSFSFYRKMGADKFLRESDIDVSQIDNTKIFHFGTLSLTDEPSRSATKYAMKYADEKGKIISFDPNWRPPLWSGVDVFLEQSIECLPYCTVVKMSEEELALFTNTNDIEKGIESLLSEYENILVLCVTMGKEGCFICNRKQHTHVPIFDAGQPIDTTGAGDCFFGAFLYKLLKSGEEVEKISHVSLVGCAEFASKVAGISTTRHGGIPSIPTIDEL